MRHEELANGGWRDLSLMEQLGNIGSEINRAANAEGKDEERFRSAAERALELFDLTLSDSRWRGRQREIARAREVFCDTVFGTREYKDTLKNLLRYFDEFAYAARMKE